jgi:F-type H+-transporting ATPase subunit b
MKKLASFALAFSLASAAYAKEAAPAAEAPGAAAGHAEDHNRTGGAPTQEEAHHFCEHTAAHPRINWFNFSFDIQEEGHAKSASVKEYNEHEIEKCVESVLANGIVTEHHGERHVDAVLLDSPKLHKPDLVGTPMIASIINFLILAFLLSRLARKPLAEFLNKRHDDIKKGLEESTKRFQEAQARLAEYEQKLRSMEETRRGLIADYEEQAKREVERVRQEAEKQIAKIRSDAEREVQVAVVTAERTLRREAAEAAIKTAESILAREIGPEDRSRLLEQFITKVSSSRSLGGAA